MSALETEARKKATTYGFRTARGEWRPPNPLRYAPIFVWPPRPKQFLQWLLAFPGFLWPYNSVYFLITVVTWLYLQPDLSRTAEFRIGWIAQMYLRNLALLWLTAGGWHALFYTFKWQDTERKFNPAWKSPNSKVFLWGNQLYDNIFWSCVSGCTVWTAYEVLFMWAYANGLIPAIDWRTQPVYFIVWLCLIPFWREFHFYWIHRLINWKPLYRYVHYLHHKNVNVGPWSGLAMHPVEHILYFSVVLIHWLVPSHPIHMLFNAQHTALSPAKGHSGFDDVLITDELSLRTGTLFHYLHHRYFECNYGEITIPLDKWFGTFHDGSATGDVAMQARKRQRLGE